MSSASSEQKSFSFTAIGPCQPSSSSADRKMFLRKDQQKSQPGT